MGKMFSKSKASSVICFYFSFDRFIIFCFLFFFWRRWFMWKFPTLISSKTKFEKYKSKPQRVHNKNKKKIPFTWLKSSLDKSRLLGNNACISSSTSPLPSSESTEHNGSRLVLKCWDSDLKIMRKFIKNFNEMRVSVFVLEI